MHSYAAIVLQPTLKIYVPLEYAAPTYDWTWNDEHQYVECKNTGQKLNQLVGGPRSWCDDRIFYGDIQHPELAEST